MAFEHLIALCNTIGAAPWFCMPHQADSAYIANFAQLVKSSLDPELKIYLEYSNEVWNGQFQQFHWVQSNGDPALNHPQKYAKFAKKVFDLWREAFAGEESRIVRVAACQHFNPWIAEQIVAFLGPGGAEVLSPAGYFGFPAAEYDSLVALGASATPEDVLRFGRASIRGENSVHWRSHLEIAQQYGIKITNYEGGQHLTTNPFGSVQPFSQAIYDAQIHPDMYQVYNELLDSLRATGSKLFMAYSLASPRESRFGSWGHLEHVYQDISEAPKYKALIDALKVSVQENRAQQPRRLYLEQNYPNPFNPETTIRYRIPKAAHVRLEIFDLLGRKIVTLVDQKQPAGNHAVKWNGKNALGQNVASGVYLYRLQTGELVQVKKLALMR